MILYWIPFWIASYISFCTFLVLSFDILHLSTVSLFYCNWNSFIIIIISFHATIENSNYLIETILQKGCQTTKLRLWRRSWLSKDYNIIIIMRLMLLKCKLDVEGRITLTEIDISQIKTVIPTLKGTLDLQNPPC